MKLNAINNSPSFGKIVIEDGKQTRTQKKIIKRILKDRNLTSELVENLEKSNTDIYIKPNANGDSVDLRLYTDIDFFGIRVTPYCKLNHQMKATFNPSYQSEFNINVGISNFFERASKMNLHSDKNVALVNAALANPKDADHY